METVISELINDPKVPKWIRFIAVAAVCGFVAFVGVALAIKSQLPVRFSAALCAWRLLRLRFTCFLKLQEAAASVSFKRIKTDLPGCNSMDCSI